MRYFCTYFDSNYLPQGLALHESMQTHCQPYLLHVLALDEAVDLALDLPNVVVTSLDDFLTNELRAAIIGRTHRESIWTYTGRWMQYVFEIKSSAHALNYIDADCYFFADPSPVFDEIGGSDIAITPHRFPERAKHFESNGLFNVGLVHIKRAGMACLNEWAQQCVEWCYEVPDGKRYADQKYLDVWPEKYGAHSIRHLGANLAPWCQEQYDYTIEGGHLYVNGQPLIWYHFHQGLEPKWPMNEWVMDWAYWRYEKALESGG